MGMDYKTIKHHIEILAAHGLITAEGLKYNVVYFPSQILEDNKDIFDEVCAKIGSSKNRRGGVERWSE